MVEGQAAIRPRGTDLPPAPKPPKIDTVQLRTTKAVIRNGDLDWDVFKPRPYHAHNYLKLRDDDQQIVETTRDFFAASGLGTGAHGVDVGTGANLYPALAMLPFCGQIDLVERSGANVRWLRRQRAWWQRFDRRWTPFWRLYTRSPQYGAYDATHHYRADFSRKTTVQQSSVFDLPHATWDVGTMFFVACSISTELADFNTAVARFVRSLKNGAPFAIAFMTGSTGYDVGGEWFPAVELGVDNVERALASVAGDFTIHKIDSHDPLRPGVGMLLATGRARQQVEQSASYPVGPDCG